MDIAIKFLEMISPNRPDVIGITDNALELVLAIGEAKHPEEMITILTSDPIHDIQGINAHEKDNSKHVINGVYMAPKSITSNRSASFNPHLLPASFKRAGIAHSHPSGVTKPSTKDLNSGFSKGDTHIIVGPPYERDSWDAYNKNGEKIDLKVFEVSDDVENNFEEKMEI